MSRGHATAARPGWVYLVGAGPGDPELITVRGAELLASADLVLHDELLHPAQLARCRPDAEVRAVGKRGSDPGSKQAAQEAISEQLVAAGRAGRSVVRLKGGDPLLFGRGSEEALALRAAGVPFAIVPGVSSPVGATAYAGITLTQRELASSVSFVTAVTKNGAAFDFAQLAGTQGTVCVFMTTRHLERTCRGLMIDAGRAPSTPAAVVEWISYPKQRTIVGELADIADRARDAGIERPSLLVIGDVVSLREQLSWFDRQPLFGKRVLVTRPAQQAAPTAKLLRQRGAEPVVFPTIAMDPPADGARVANAVRELGGYDLVAFTSANAVSWLWREIDAQHRDARVFGSAVVAAIGPATAEALARRGIVADVVADVFVAEHLAEAIVAALGDGAAGKRVLLPRAAVAREMLPDALRRAGLHVDVVPVYRTVTASPARSDELRELIASIDVVMLTSSSTVENLCALLGEDAVERLAPCVLASIGPITTQTAEELGLSVAITANVSTAAGLIDALEAGLATASSRSLASA